MELINCPLKVITEDIDCRYPNSNLGPLNYIIIDIHYSRLAVSYPPWRSAFSSLDGFYFSSTSE